MLAYSAADIQLLLSTCQLGLGTIDSLDGSSIDGNSWRGTLNAALDHGLIAQLNNNIQHVSGIPAELLPEIQGAFLAQASRNLQLTSALFEIIASFRAVGIEPAVIKGAAVALIAHKHITQREFTDLDLLIRPHDISEARLILHKLGYRQLPKQQCKPRSEKDIQFTRDTDDVLVELHWALNPSAKRFPLEANGIWNRLQTLPFQTNTIRTLGLEDTFLSLCIHGCVHGWTSLKWAYDIALLISAKDNELNWRALVNHSATAGCLNSLLTGVQLSSTLFNVPVPDGLAAQVSMPASILRTVEEMRVAIVESRPLSRSDLAFSHIRLHDHRWDRLLVAYRYLPDVHPITAGPLRYLIRPIRLLQWYGLKRICAAIAAP